eukprot:1951546-Karenia_brevis.AAC.1
MKTLALAFVIGQQRCNSIADILTKGQFTSMQWELLCSLMQLDPSAARGVKDKTSTSSSCAH